MYVNIFYKVKIHSIFDTKFVKNTVATTYVFVTNIENEFLAFCLLESSAERNPKMSLIERCFCYRHLPNMESVNIQCGRNKKDSSYVNKLYSVDLPQKLRTHKQSNG